MSRGIQNALPKTEGHHTMKKMACGTLIMAKDRHGKPISKRVKDAQLSLDLRNHTDDEND